MGQPLVGDGAVFGAEFKADEVAVVGYTSVCCARATREWIEDRVAFVAIHAKDVGQQWCRFLTTVKRPVPQWIDFLISPHIARSLGGDG